jgi:anti-sigma-K factor RskA
MTTDVHSLLGAYLLDAVDDVERAAFDRHLRECEDCRAEVDELRETTARLADNAWSVPPPALREKVLAEVTRTPQLAPAGQLQPAKLRTTRWLLTAAAAVVLTAAGATTTYVIQEQRVRDQHALAEAARASETRVRTILAAPDLVLRQETVTGGGRVTVDSSRLNNAGLIVLAADAAPAGGKVYQLWTIRPGGEPASAAVLDPGESATVQLVEGLPGASEVGLTIEPPRGSTTPTLPMVADVKLA